MNANKSKEKVNKVISPILGVIVILIIVVVLSYLIAEFIIVPAQNNSNTPQATPQIDSNPIVGTWSCTISDLVSSRTVYFQFLNGGNCYFSFDENKLTQYQGNWENPESYYDITFLDNPFGQDKQFMMTANIEKDGSLTINYMASSGTKSYILKRK